MIFSQKLIRSSEIPSEPQHQLCDPVIQPTVHKISRPQAFWAAIFFKCPPSAILFLMNSFQKLMRSSEIPREPAYKI